MESAFFHAYMRFPMGQLLESPMVGAANDKQELNDFLKDRTTQKEQIQEERNPSHQTLTAEKIQFQDNGKKLEDNINNAQFNINWVQLGSWVRWSGTIVLVLLIVGSNIRFLRYCRKNRIQYRRGTGHQLTVYLLEGIKSPFLFGKSIYVDPNMTIHEKSFRYICQHETCHYENHDMIWMFLRFLCISLNWYNPFVWVAAYYVKQDCELACDEAVLRALGQDKFREYGQTLIELLQNQKNTNKNRKISLATSMSCSKNKLKERLRKLRHVKNNSRVMMAMIFILMLCLTGCTFSKSGETTETRRSDTENAGTEEVGVAETNIEGANRTEEANEEAIASNIIKTDQKDTINENSQNSSMSQSDFDSNTYYNRAKYEDGYFYYTNGNRFCRRKADSQITDDTTEELLAEGAAKLGNIVNHKIYYIKYPTEDANKAGIMYYDTEKMAEEQLTEWEDDLWLCNDIYVVGNMLYQEMGDRCLQYEIVENILQPVSESANTIYQALSDCSLSVEKISNLIPGYVSTCFQYGYLVLYDSSQNQMVWYDTKMKQKIGIITDCYHDVLVSEYGIVYKTLDNSIYLRKWKENESTQLYSPEEHQGTVLNYGTFDKNYIYAFIEKQTEVEMVRISWSGEYESYVKIMDVDKAVELGLSVNNGYLCFYQNGTVVFMIDNNQSEDLTEERKIEPVPLSHVKAGDNMPNGIYRAIFAGKNVIQRQNSYYAEMDFQEYDRYMPASIQRMKEGDSIEYLGTQQVIKYLVFSKNAEGRIVDVAINGGFDGSEFSDGVKQERTMAGFSLRYEEQEDVYRTITKDNLPVYYSIGKASLPIADNLTFTDYDSSNNDSNAQVRKGDKAIKKLLDLPNDVYDVRINNGQIVEITQNGRT